MTTVNNSKFLNQDGDYYFCNLCNRWHRYRIDTTSLGYKHIANLDEEKTNSSSSKYFFCALCSKWHTDARKDHLQHRLHIQRDTNINPAPTVHPSRAPLLAHHHLPTAILGSFDGAAGLWKNESEHLSSIPSPEARRQCEGILALVKGLDKDLHIQYFSRKNGFSFIVKGLRIAEIRINSGGFLLMLIQNTKVPGSTRPRQVKKKFLFTGLEKPPISDSELLNHFVSEAKNLIYLRKKNSIGLYEKWLHCLLIEKMQDDGLARLDLDFLFYEAPAAKIKRNKRFRHETIDILARERRSKALVVVEVKKQGEDLNSAVSQGLSYVGWLAKYKEQLKPRMAQLGWDVDIENLKLIVIAPDTAFKNTSLDAHIMKQSKRLNCEVIAAYLNPDYVKNENVYIKEIKTSYALRS